MSADGTAAEVRDRAALYALGMLEPDEVRAFEARLRSGCPVAVSELRAASETLALLAWVLPETGPAPRVREKLLAAVDSRPESSDVSPGVHVVRAGEGSWQPSGVAGVWTRPLHADPAGDSIAMLVRMEPGATYPAHRHAAPEHCLVLEGDLRTSDLVLQVGDYQYVGGDTLHRITGTAQGCLLLVITSPRNMVVE